MPEIISLNAEPRPRAGKGAARATRRGGRVPGIVYGGDKEPVLISLEPRELARLAAKPGFFATLVDISVDGTTHRTLARDVQHHPISDAPMHADFMRVAAGAQVTVTVPVAFVNHERSIGLRRGGILNIVRHGIEMICSVDNIPERVVVDLDGLDIGDSIHSGAVEMPASARPAIQRNFTIASIAASSAVKEEAAQAAATAAVAAAAPPTEEPAAPAPTTPAA
jgi:large subunit ribosomal protein L25